jgi:hypothetical protein
VEHGALTPRLGDGLAYDRLAIAAHGFGRVASDAEARVVSISDPHQSVVVAAIDGTPVPEKGTPVVSVVSVHRGDVVWGARVALTERSLVPPKSLGIVTPDAMSRAE